MNGRVDGGVSAERGENFGLFGLEVFENEGLGLAGFDPTESGRGLNLGPAVFFPYFANAFLGLANAEGRPADDRDENLIGWGFDVFANESLGLADECGRKRDERGLEPDRLGLAPVRAGEPAGTAVIDGCEWDRGLNPVPVPWFASFANVEGRFGDEPGTNLGLADCAPGLA